MARIIGILSAKGGVGKTTTTVNLGVALVDLGKEVIVIDANLSASNLGLHLGMLKTPQTLNDYIRNKVKKMKEIVYTHSTGMKVIPSTISLDLLENVHLEKFKKGLKTLDADFILIDSAPGLNVESLMALDACDEIIVVTTPEIPSLTNAYRTINVAHQKDIKVLGVILNRVSKKESEVTVEDVEHTCKEEVIQIVPEDSMVQESMVLGLPVVRYDPLSNASQAFIELAHKLVGKPYVRKKRDFFDMLVKWLRSIKI